MPYATSVRPGLRLGMAHMAGDVTGTEIANASAALYTDPEWQPGYDEIWDLSAIRAFDVTPEEMRAIVQYEEDALDEVGTGRVALVVTRDVVEMVGVLYQKLVASLGRSVEITKTVEDAAARLGLDAVPAWFSDIRLGDAEPSAPSTPSDRLTDPMPPG